MEQRTEQIRSIAPYSSRVFVGSPATLAALRSFMAETQPRMRAADVASISDRDTQPLPAIKKRYPVQMMFWSFLFMIASMVALFVMQQIVWAIALGVIGAICSALWLIDMCIVYAREGTERVTLRVDREICRISSEWKR
jgi:hypothetical protein